jgi:hypothetical protein
MRLTRGKKIALGIATAWAPAHLLVFMGAIFTFMFLRFTTEARGGTPAKGIPTVLTMSEFIRA